MIVESFHYEPIADTVVVDLSWLMYLNYHAMRGLRVLARDGTVIPTGHIHGALTTIAQIAFSSSRVILAVDSRCPYRFEVFPEYKSGRHDKKEGEPDIRAFVKAHTPLILAASTQFRNVFFVKKEGWEADDLINHIVFRGDDPIIFGRDNDLMQLHQPFRVSNSLAAGKPVIIDTEKYLVEKYGVPLPFLPIWWKVIRGDPSDSLPGGIPRYPAKKLIPLCLELKEERDFSALEKYATDRMDSVIATHLTGCLRNWKIVSPYRYPDDLPFMVKRISEYPVAEQLHALQLANVASLISVYMNAR